MLLQAPTRAPPLIQSCICCCTPPPAGPAPPARPLAAIRAARQAPRGSILEAKPRIVSAFQRTPKNRSASASTLLKGLKDLNPPPAVAPRLPPAIPRAPWRRGPKRPQTPAVPPFWRGAGRRRRRSAGPAGRPRGSPGDLSETRKKPVGRGFSTPPGCPRPAPPGPSAPSLPADGRRRPLAGRRSPPPPAAGPGCPAPRASPEWR